MSATLSPRLRSAARPTRPRGRSHDLVHFVVSGARASACDTGHDPCEVLIDYTGFNLMVDIWDVTDKASPFLISSLTYNNAGFTHSGWLSQDTMFVTLQDELDEFTLGNNTLVRVLDISDLAAPVLSGSWTGSTAAIDHNGLMSGNLLYMSNYNRGLTVLDFSLPNEPREIGFFDTFPPDDDAAFDGAWGVFPYLPSGNVLMSDRANGFFVLAVSPHPAPTLSAIAPDTVAAGGTGQTLTVTGTNFDTASVVRWDGANRATTFVSSTELQIEITPGDLASGGTAEVAVFNPEPEGGSAGPATLTVSSYALGASPASATVAAGLSASYTLTVTPEFGAFDPSVSFSCAGVPELSSCSFSPATVNPGANPATSTLTVSTTGKGAVLPVSDGLPRGIFPLLLVLSVLLGFSLVANGARPRTAPRLAAAAVLCLLMALAACGGNKPRTPAGTHTITVTASSGTFQQSMNVTLVVQ